RRRLRGSPRDFSPCVSPGGGTASRRRRERRSKALWNFRLAISATERQATAHSSVIGRAGACRRGRRARRRGGSRTKPGHYPAERLLYLDVSLDVGLSAVPGGDRDDEQVRAGRGGRDGKAVAGFVGGGKRRIRL